eukprot:1856739-Karenia_brevis.AAC.1
MVQGVLTIISAEIDQQYMLIKYKNTIIYGSAPEDVWMLGEDAKDEFLELVNSSEGCSYLIM